MYRVTSINNINAATILNIDAGSLITGAAVGGAVATPLILLALLLLLALLCVKKRAKRQNDLEDNIRMQLNDLYNTTIASQNLISTIACNLELPNYEEIGQQYIYSDIGKPSEGKAQTDDNQDASQQTVVESEQ